MALNEITVLREDYQFYGRFNLPLLTGTNVFDVYGAIRTDLITYFNADERIFAYTDFKALIEVVDFDPTVVQTYGGNPPRRRFGTYVFRNADVFFENNFVTYEKQQTRKAKTWIVRDELSPLTAFAPEATFPDENTFISLLNDRQTDSSTPVATVFEIDLNPSVVANVSIVYSGDMGFYFDGDFFSIQTFVNL